MRRFFFEEIRPVDKGVTLGGTEARHMIRVLRMVPGDRLILMDGRGSRFLAVIESMGRHEVRVILERDLPQPPPSPVVITLGQALLKSRAMDELIHRTTELGVNRIIPFVSERTVIRMDGERFSRRVKHWHGIVRSAAKLSDGSPPQLSGRLCSYEALLTLAEKEDGLKVILWEEEDAEDLKGLIRESKEVVRVFGMVGPEGGFTRDEVRGAEEVGFISVSLGRRILRAETAASTLVALVQYEFGDLGLDPVIPPP
jgi:16S rRNA (uracil1498-N3)-methyltransferase